MDFQLRQNNRCLSLKHFQMTRKTLEKKEHFAFGLIALEIQPISTMSLRISETGGVSLAFLLVLLFMFYIMLELLLFRIETRCKNHN